MACPTRSRGEHRLCRWRFLKTFDTHCMCFIPWAIPVSLPRDRQIHQPPHSRTHKECHSCQSCLGTSCGKLFVCYRSVSSGVSALYSLAKTRLTLVYSFLNRVPQLAISSYFFLELGTGCPEEAQQCFHAMLLGQPSWPAHLGCKFNSSSKLHFKSGSTQIVFLCLGSSTYCRARLASEKYVSSSPSHPRIHEDRSVSNVSRRVCP